MTTPATSPKARRRPYSRLRPQQQPRPQPHPQPLDAALLAAEETLRRNDEIAAVFIVAPNRPPAMRQDVTILRRDPVDLAPASGIALFHVPHWAETLLAPTEGVR